MGHEAKKAMMTSCHAVWAIEQLVGYCRRRCGPYVEGVLIVLRESNQPPKNHNKKILLRFWEEAGTGAVVL